VCSSLSPLSSWIHTVAKGRLVAFVANMDPEVRFRDPLQVSDAWKACARGRQQGDATAADNDGLHEGFRVVRSSVGMKAREVHDTTHQAP